MQSIKDILQGFDPISLREMDGSELMERMDLKYFFTVDQLPAVLSHLTEHYKVLCILDNRLCKYESLYFDTPDFELFYNHHRGRSNRRYKIRFRKYVESELHFFEVKFKNRRGRTIKDRVMQGRMSDVIQHNAEEFLKEKTPLEAGELEPKLMVRYCRMTLVNKLMAERVTIDLNLNFQNNDGGDRTIDNLIIAEVKQDKSFVSPFIKVMRELHIREASLSKYCFGVITLFENMKHNNFKPNLIYIKKLLNGTLARTTH
ncbi:MAG: hypothetical protein JWP12_1797 [Bacteroidetes bacterium]|nr:hypothetical protein [Bacteroidota bacterium]